MKPGPANHDTQLASYVANLPTPGTAKCFNIAVVLHVGLGLTIAHHYGSFQSRRAALKR
jgi:hypothetical protein